jgi:serine protease Do
MKSSSIMLLPSCLIACLLTPACQAQMHARVRAHEPSANLLPDEAAVVALHRRVLPTVVTVMTVAGAGTASPKMGLGTGVMITPESRILTAAHVVDGADQIQVKTQDGRRRAAEIVFSEPDADVALLRLLVPDATLPHAQLGDSDHTAVGQNLLLIGNPRGLENSLSVGHVSGFREFGSMYDGSILLEFIQTDAAINSGNSGGPAFDSAGRVVGIASRILTHSGGSEGLGLIVGINTCKQLLALERRSWTGMRGVFLPAADLAALLNVDQGGGLLVQTVVRNSPAEIAGLHGGTVAVEYAGQRLLLGGDLILQIGDQEACHAECLAAAHDRLTKADTLAIRFLRGGKVMTVTVDVTATHRNFLVPEPAKR